MQYILYHDHAVKKVSRKYVLIVSKCLILPNNVFKCILAYNIILIASELWVWFFTIVKLTNIASYMFYTSKVVIRVIFTLFYLSLAKLIYSMIRYAGGRGGEGGGGG